MKTESHNSTGFRLVFAAALLACAAAQAHDETPSNPSAGTNAPTVGGGMVQSAPGDNAWNTGQPPADWWEEIRRQHGHVGPWNVLGWRIGQAALREFKTAWGRHDLEIICYLPPQTPFTCLVDGASVGTGNSMGRLDLRMAEVFTARQCHVAVRRKDGKGGVLEFLPKADYLEAIMNRPVAELERLSRECSRMDERELFTVQRVVP